MSKFDFLNKRLQEHVGAYRDGLIKTQNEGQTRLSAGASATRQAQLEARSYSSRNQFNQAHDRVPSNALKPKPPKPPAPPVKPKPVAPLKPLAPLKPKF
ncbi:MAG: hypothetical protein K1X29_08145 [Bdellovibrionales bacterium]|nr:hypothetical protein [Bdellovibrionales bacterium]